MIKSQKLIIKTASIKIYNKNISRKELAV